MPSRRSQDVDQLDFFALLDEQAAEDPALDPPTPAAARSAAEHRAQPVAHPAADAPAPPAAVDPAPAEPHGSVDATPSPAPAPDALVPAGAVDFVPPAGLTVPSGDLARARANLAALTTLRTLTEQQRPATPAEQVVLAAWSGWGALPHVFDASAEQGAESWWPHRYDTLIPPRVADLAHVADPAAVTAFAARLADIRAGGLDPHAVAQQLRAVAAEVPASGTDQGAALAARLTDVAVAAEWDPFRADLAQVTTVAERLAAARSTLNAHYTDPVVVSQSWRALTELGFTAGRVLEPGCGSGNFIGRAPAGAVMTGVELDPTTAGIAAALYPSADIVTAGFEGPGWNEGTFSAAVGNVPFGNFKVYDPTFNPRGHSIHNHFLLKALRLTAPGGVLAMVTSTYTLDAASPAARRELHEHGDLLGAVRLPAGTFRAVAGTDVVTDLLILRRRKDGETPLPLRRWERAADVVTDTGTVAVNQYYAEHPDQVLGRLTIGNGPHHRAQMTVLPDPDTDLATELAARVDRIVAFARGQNLTQGAPSSGLGPVRDPAAAAGQWQTQARPGAIRTTPGGGFERLSPATRTWLPYPLRAGKTDPAARAEARALLALRDSADELIAAQAAGAGPDDRAAARARTAALYRAYVDRFGPINRYTVVERASWVGVDNVDPDEIDPDWPVRHRTRKGAAVVTDDGDPVLEVRRVRGDQVRPRAVEALRFDPGFATVLALEIFDHDTRTATPAPILTEDVLTVRGRPQVAANAAEALAISLDETGQVDLTRIAGLLEGPVTTEQARTRLAGLVYDDPDTGELIPAVSYLSGDVRSKLDTAHAAAALDARYTVNVDALAAVLPADLGPSDIEARPGVTWVDTADYARFVTEVLEAPGATVSWQDLIGRYEVTVPAHAQHSRAVRTTYGTPTHDGIALLQSLMTNTPVLVTRTAVDYEGHERQVPDPDATEAANAKRTALAHRFSAWLWEDPDRAARLADVYNRRFNAHVPTAYDGSHLSLPGLGDHFTPRPTQTAAVARILDQPTVLLDHVVGAGKTGTMVMAAMELRRLGHARQPWIVVPNHLVEQVAREAKQWYPAARVLAGTASTDAEGRRELTALTATGDYDMIIVPETLSTAIPVSTRTQQAYFQERIDQLTEALSHRGDAKAARGRSDTTKSLEVAKARLESRLTSFLAEGKAGRDTGITFDQAGCDYIFCDEFHHFKNRQVISSTRDLARAEDSQRALDLSMKIRVLRDARTENGRTPGVFTGATGTPIPNSPREMWVVFDYLRPDLLRAAGVATFDAWVANHLRPQTRLEMKPTGTGFAPRTRITQFVNVPEMSRMWRQMADLVTRDDLDVTLPALAGGARHTVALPRTPEQIRYAQHLDARVAAIKSGAVRPEDDNMLAVTGDGRKAALDPRLVGLPAPADGGRPTALVREILRIHHATAGRRYLDDTGTPSPTPGGLQIVFCDQSTPKAGQWTVYRQIRDELVGAGMNPERVRFIHDAAPGAQRAELFAACRDGRVSVLIGSTAKLGTGANIQSRAVAEHHVDVPWRPADLEQREGRVIRQGNQNDTVEIWTYVTENSFDAFSWTLVATKAAFIAQIKNGTTARHVEADDYDAASYEQIAAISSGDPRIMQRYQLGIDLARLERLERAHHAEQRSLSYEARSLTAHADALTHAVEHHQPTVEVLTPTTGDAFTMTINGRQHADRADAGRALFHLIAANNPEPGIVRRVDQIIGRLGGLDLRMHADPVLHHKIHLSFPVLEPVNQASTIHGDAAYVDTADLNSATTPGLGLVRRLEHHLLALPAKLEQMQGSLAAAPIRIAETRALIGAAFPQQDELAGTRARIRVLDAELTTPTADSIDPPPPRWLTQLPEDQADQLIWGPRLQRLHPDGAGTVADLKPGDVLAAATSTGHPRVITHLTGYSTRAITTTELGGHRETVTSKRRTTGIGIVARRRGNLTPIETAIADAPLGVVITTCDELSQGAAVTVEGMVTDGFGNVTDYDVVSVTGTISSIDGDGHHRGRPTRRLTLDTDRGPVRIQTYSTDRAVVMPEGAAAGGPSAATAPVSHPAVPSRAAATAPDPLAVDRAPVAPPADSGQGQPKQSSTPIHRESPTDPRADFTVPADDRDAYPAQNADPSGRVTSAETDLCDEPVAIQHGTSGTVVTGTTRDDTVMRDTLKSVGFKWSRAQGFWYLPRSMHQHTRTLRVDQLTSAAGRAGRIIPVVDHAEDWPTPGVEAPQVVMAASASDACPAQSCAVDLTP